LRPHFTCPSNYNLSPPDPTPPYPVGSTPLFPSPLHVLPHGARTRPHRRCRPAGVEGTGQREHVHDASCCSAPPRRRVVHLAGAAPSAPLPAPAKVANGGAEFLRRRAASPSGCCHETSFLHRSSLPICLNSPHYQPASSPRWPFSRRRQWQDAFSRQRLTLPVPQRLASTRPSCIDLHGASRRHLGRRQHHNITNTRL
jgi:hypothetical protein